MSKQQGFTLLELLLASVLMAVLMVGVMSVIAHVVRPVESLAESNAQDAYALQRDAWVRLIHEDLSRARMIETQGDELVVMNYNGLDALTSERTQRPVRIRYAIRQVGRRPCLVRFEQALDAIHTGAPERRELVAVGVTRLELEQPAGSALPLAPGTRAGRNDSAGGDESQQNSELPIDGLWRLRLWADAGEAPAVERSLAIRRSLAQ